MPTPVATPPPAPTASYYIDFQNGSDLNDGRSASTAFKHSPGDAAATGVAGVTQLIPGDVVLFRGGVTYDSSIAVRSGVKYLGTGWGVGKAIIRGSDKLASQLTRCASAADCRGNANYENVYYATLPPGTPDFTVGFFENGKLLNYAQFPNQSGIDWDDMGNYKKIPLGSATIKETINTITDPTVFTQTDPNFWIGSTIGVWASGNYIHRKKIIAYDPATHTITHEALDAGLTKYTDRDSVYSLLNHPSLIDIPGEYAVDQVSNRIYVWPSGTAAGTELRYLARSTAIMDYWITPSNVTVDGFEILHFTFGIHIPSENASHTLIQNNYVHDLQSNGNYAISAGGSNTTFKNNRVSRARQGVGILSNGRDILIQDNLVEETSRQGIWIMKGTNGRIIGNTVKDLKGTHANGISVYWDSFNMLIANNQILNCYSPITSERTFNLTLYGNYVNNGGFSEWGGATGTLRLINNTFVNAPYDQAVLLNSTSTASVVMVNNVVDGGGKGEPRANNVFTALQWYQIPEYGFVLAPSEQLVTDQTKIFNADGYTPLVGGVAEGKGVDATSYLPISDHPGFNWYVDALGKTRNVDAAWDIGAFAR